MRLNAWGRKRRGEDEKLILSPQAVPTCRGGFCLKVCQEGDPYLIQKQVVFIAAKYRDIGFFYDAVLKNIWVLDPSNRFRRGNKLRKKTRKAFGFFYFLIDLAEEFLFFCVIVCRRCS